VPGQIQEQLVANARNHPNRVLFGFHRKPGETFSVTFRQFHDDVAAAAKSNTASPHSLHFIAGKTGYEAIVTYVSAIVNQQYPAFLSPLTPRSDPDIYKRELARLIQRFRPHRVSGFPEGFVTGTTVPEPVHDGYGFVQFSSGTIGLRKGVFIGEQALADQLTALAARLAIGPDDVVASWLPLYHDMGLITSLFLPIFAGCSSYMMDPIEWSFRPQRILSLIAEHQATLCWQPDFALQHLSNWHDAGNPNSLPSLATLRLMTSCSEPCRLESFQRFFDRFGCSGLRGDSLQTCYATAETVFAVTQSNFQTPADWSDNGSGILSSGHPLENCELETRMCDEQGRGQIWLRCPFLFSGYLFQDTPAIQGNWYNTGDLGHIVSDTVTVYGRTDDTLIINGKKLFAHEVEQKLNSLPEIKGGRVICLANQGGSGVNIFYEGIELSPGSAQHIRTWVATACHVSIDQVQLVPDRTLVKSSSGKISRRKTEQKLREQNLLAPAPAPHPRNHQP
jgi:fatty-acyl-CoA synthase